MKHSERIKKQQKHTAPNLIVSYKFLQHYAMSVWIKQSQDPQWAPLNMHRFLVTDVSWPIPVCPDKPEHKTQKAITHSGGPLYPFVAITRKLVQKAW